MNTIVNWWLINDITWLLIIHLIEFVLSWFSIFFSAENLSSQDNIGNLFALNIIFHKLVLGHVKSQWFIFLHLKSGVDFYSQSLQMTSCSSFQLIFFSWKRQVFFKVFIIMEWGVQALDTWFIHTSAQTFPGNHYFFSWLLLFFCKKTTLDQQQKSGEKKISCYNKQGQTSCYVNIN